MTPDEVGRALLAELPDDIGATATVSGGGRWARSTVDVPGPAWVAALGRARSGLGCDFFDWLSAVDDQDRGYQVVAHVWSTAARFGVLVRTRVPGSAPSLPSIVALYPGAAWHERETHEMFGLDFPGHPDLAPLLLAPEFEGHPLRKDFVLASRVVKAWPGAREPGESAAEADDIAASPGRSSSVGRRQPLRPPGVPGPGEWAPAEFRPDPDGSA